MHYNVISFVFSNLLMLVFHFLNYYVLCFRSRIAIIPQEPFLFCGTVRENIDPLDEYRDSELAMALQRCHLATAINRLGGLGSQVGHGGHNLSMGQRQLLCLVRAVLHNAKVGVVLTYFLIGGSIM
jgi:ABC-type multidrug transport system fused ATPase/permease subunit